MTLAPGSRFGAYGILGTLGAGAMGEVYRARDPQLNRDVAIKVIPDDFASDPARLARFEREAHTLAALNHPHIAQIYGIERSGDARGLVLELVEGPTLEERITRGRLPIAEATSIARQIAEALEAAHAKGIVHRDLKPANIKLNESGRVKVLDFGLAFAVAGSAAGTEARTVLATGEGMVAGTAPYMSPEQARGEPVDARTDIWAFGCIVFEMLAGRRAFPGSTIPDAIASVLTREPDWTALPAGLPPLTGRLIRRCLAKDRRERLHSIADARFDLDDAKAFEGGASPRRALALPALATAGALLVIALVAYLVWSRQGGAAASAGMPSVFGIPEPPGESLYLFAQPLALSPDGRRLAVVTNSPEGQPRIWLRSLDALSPQLLEGSEGGLSPFWSADGRSLAFIANGRLKVIDLASTSVRTLLEGITGYGGGAWRDRDGTMLLATRFSGGIDQITPGSEAKAITTLDTARGEIMHSRPQFMPDRKHFIYFAKSTRPGESGMMFGEPGSAAYARVLTIESPATYAPPGYLLYARGDELVAQPFDGARGTVSGDPLVIAGRVWNVGGFVSITASTGGEVAFATRRTPSAQLTFVNRSGQAVGTAGDPGEWVHVAFSPDGRRIAAELLDPKTGAGAVWIIDPARKASTRVSLDPSWGLAPAWLHDGSGVVFGSTRLGVSDLFVNRLDGTDDRPVLVSPELKNPTDVLADGRVLFNVTTQAGTDVGSVSLRDPGDRQQVVVGRYSEGYAKASPDEHWLAYTSNESGRPEVYVRPFGPGAASRRWQVSAGGGSQPRWRTDGKELFFVAEDGTLMASQISDRGTFTAAPPVALLFKTARDITGWRYTYDVTDLGERFLILRTTTADPAPAITVLLNWQQRARHP